MLIQIGVLASLPAALAWLIQEKKVEAWTGENASKRKPRKRAPKVRQEVKRDPTF